MENEDQEEEQKEEVDENEMLDRKDQTPIETDATAPKGKKRGRKKGRGKEL